MPAFDLDSQSPGGSFDPDPPDGWSMPIGQVGGIRFFVSYAIFVALAVLAGLVAMVQSRPGNGDLPLVTLSAVAIWGTGWLVQVIVQLAMHFGSSAKCESITIGLLGIELPSPLYRRQTWSAFSNLTLAFCCVVSLVAFGMGCLLIHMRSLGLTSAGWTVWWEQLSRPSFGLAASQHRYLSATWLFWIQAACQAYPLPRNLGRAAMASAITLLAAEAHDQLQIKLLRRMLQLIAIVTVVIAMATMLADSDVFLPRWPVLVCLSLMLWFSTSQRDLADWIASIHVANDDPVLRRREDPERLSAGSFVDSGSSPPTEAVLAQDHGESSADPERDPAATTRRGWFGELADSIRMRQKRRLAKLALDRERAEASDAARLDEVLTRVSKQGTEGLNEEDRALLKRVSDNLRRDRNLRRERDEKPPMIDRDELS